jgi:F-type H+-transporting ATPase subunit delta
MDENYIIARPYAKAIFALALADNKLHQWSEILNILTYIAQNIYVEKILGDPEINWQQRASLFADICAQIIDEKGKNFLKVLAMHGRLAVLPIIAELYEELHNKHENVVKTKIISTMPLLKEQQEKLQQRLQKRIGAKIIPQYQQDQSLLGGIVIRIGDQVIDGSIRGKLQRLAKYLTG